MMGCMPLENMVGGYVSIEKYEALESEISSLRAELEQLKAERDWHSVDDGDNLTRCLCFLGISIERYSLLGHQHWPTPEFQRAVRHVLAEMSDFGRKITADNESLRAENAALREEVETLRTFKEELQSHPLFGSPGKALIEDDVDGNKTTRTINGFFGGHKGELIPEGEIVCNFLDCYGGDGLAGFGFCEIEGCEPRNSECPAQITLCPFCNGEGLDSAPGAPLHEIKERLTWQPIESAPKDKPLLFLLKAGGIKRGFWDKERECWDANTMFDLTSHITHWALIPKMPKE